MDTKLLIDAIVQQTTVLIAQLSTAAGIRAPLAHIADQVFLELAREIESQGVGRKVVADMFGMALRSYQRRVQRLSESASTRGRSLWEAVYDFVSSQESVLRSELDARFRHDPADDVGAVLSDLCASGLLYSTGRGARARFRAVSTAEREADAAQDTLEGAASILWVTVYRARSMRQSELAARLALGEERLSLLVQRLVDDGRLQYEEAGPDPRLTASTFRVPLDTEQGWEGAVFDHFSAMASAIAAKVNQRPGARRDDRVGGATLSFDVHAGHPHRAEVIALLQRVRADVNEVWDRVVAHNQAHPVEDDQKERVVFYFGQHVEPQRCAGEEGEQHDA